MLSFITTKLNLIKKAKRHENILESTYLIRCLRKVVGASVITIEWAPEDKVISAFTCFGFINFIIWYTSHYYCLYKIYMEDQTILRTLYNTRLQRYGDEVERFIVGIFMLYAMWKVPFDLSGSTEDMQVILDIDKSLQDLNENVNYSHSLHLSSVVFAFQVVISSTRILVVWLSLLRIGTTMPVEKIFEMVFTDATMFIITAQYCSYLLILKRRYKIVNRALDSIRLRITSDFVKNRFQHATVRNDHSRKIKACGNIYGMLYKATKITNDKFGLVLLLMTIITLLFIILYLYYFMEATASGLFHDSQNYIDFLIYVFWQIAYVISVTLACIYFSEETVQEAQNTSQIIHEIINSEFGNIIETEAVNLSLQILHQKPSFTAYGLFKLDYVMVLEGARSVTTYLVILLQFVTDKY